MKAIAITRYGGPEVLEFVELPDPKVGPDNILVRVKAAGVNPVDWKIREGYLDSVFESHFPLVPGWDVAGVVERVGPSVTEFAPGDEVIGYVREDHIQRGTYAELVSAPVRTLARKPRDLAWTEAAGLPLAGLTAYQALTRALKVAEGETLLVHGASGGVGSIAVQLGRALGARVIGTASAGHHDYLRSLDAEAVAYGEGLVGRVRALVPGGVDTVLDLAGGDSLKISPQVLVPGGRLASVVDAQGVLELGGRYVFVRPDCADLAALADHVEQGRLSVTVAETFLLRDAAAAHRLSQSGHVRGKLVLEV